MKIYNRNEFINEVYKPAMLINSLENTDELNEGFFGNVFGSLKMLFKKEWSGIKCNHKEILDGLKKVDDKLEGFTLLKMKNGSECKKIREKLCEFGDTLYDSKMETYDKDKKIEDVVMGLSDKDDISSSDTKTVDNKIKVGKYVKQFNIKDKVIADKLEGLDEDIKDLCKKYPQLEEWTLILKKSLRNIMNDILLNKIKEDSDIKEEEKKKIEKLQKEAEEQRKKDDEAAKKASEEAKKASEAQIKEIQQRRQKILIDSGVKTIIKDKNGQKTVDEIETNFNQIKKDIIKENHKLTESKKQNKKENSTNTENGASTEISTEEYIKILNNDIYLGLNKLANKEFIENNKEKINIIIKELDIVFKAIKELKIDLKNVNSDSIQSLFVGLSKSIQYGLLGDKNIIDDDTLNLLARCAISNKTIGYGIPNIDKKHPNKGNVFTHIMQLLKDAKDKENVIGDNLNDFKANMNNLFNKIIDKANEIKEEQKKKDEEAAKKLK